MKELIHPKDKYGMNWAEGYSEWGTVKCPESIKAEVFSEKVGDIIKEKYVFTNVSDMDVFPTLGEIGIYTPFNDDYIASDICIKERCHTHLFMGENVSYVCALRMGGEAPHLGLVLTEGSLSSYSIERDLSKMSNDRGDFILHPTPVTLMPGESFTVGWTLFWHGGKEDFFTELKKYAPDFIQVEAENYTVFAEENISFKVTPNFSFTSSDVSVTLNEMPVDFSIEKGIICITQKPEGLGEQTYIISVKNISTHLKIFVSPQIYSLMEKRIAFIIDKQQYRKNGSGLDGAYLPYDNEEKHIFYNYNANFNGARERMGMGILIAAYLQYFKNKAFEDSLKKYVEYIEREVFEKDTGEVYNDFNHNRPVERLYNYPWVTIFYLELYRLWNNKEHLISAYMVLKRFYEKGGEKFYAFPIPVQELYNALERAGFDSEKDLIMYYFTRHCANILKNGLDYPAHEVNYEQSIAFPATDLLLQMYALTENGKYLEGAKIQMGALELFTGIQPDHHLYEVAIRHWDGFWFGKRRQYGDTFPHYWSSLSGIAYERYHLLTGDKDYRIKAEKSMRGSLSTFFPDGSASCACVYPLSVNGKRTGFYDPLANDQDWALYFILRLYKH